MSKRFCFFFLHPNQPNIYISEDNISECVCVCSLHFFSSLSSLSRVLEEKVVDQNSSIRIYLEEENRDG